MTNNNQSNVEFTPESGSTSFQPDSQLGTGGNWKENVNLKTVGAGVAAAAAVGGAAYAATKFFGRGSQEGQSETSQRSQKTEKAS